MKKILSFVLAGLFIFTCGCSKTVSDSSSDASSSSMSSTSSEASQTTPETDKADSSSATQTVSVDKELITVEITLPASLVEDLVNEEGFDADTYAKEQGLLSAKLNEDGSLIITMSKSKHKELLEDLSDNFKEAFQEIISNEDSEYLKDIKADKDYTSFEIYVDKDGYENSFDMTPLVLWLSASIYQTFNGVEDAQAEFKIIDQATGEEIKTIIYPE